MGVLHERTVRAQAPYQGLHPDAGAQQLGKVLLEPDDERGFVHDSYPTRPLEPLEDTQPWGHPLPTSRLEGFEYLALVLELEGFFPCV